MVRKTIDTKAEETKPQSMSIKYVGRTDRYYILTENNRWRRLMVDRFEGEFENGEYVQGAFLGCW